MTTPEIIKKILYDYRLNARQFATSVGLAPAQVYDLLSGKTKSITENVASKILEVYSELNKAWLMTGEGEMYKEGTVNFRGSSQTIDRESLKVIIDEMSAQRENAFEVIRNFQKQIDRMLTIMESRLGLPIPETDE